MIHPISQTDQRTVEDLEAMAEALGKSADFRVLRRLVPRSLSARSGAQNTRTGILFDVETTGLDSQRDEIIELAMIKFEYAPDGALVSVLDTFAAFNEPSNPIPPEITELTGITDEMVAVQKIDGDTVSAFVDDAVIVIAHNASFDCKFAERYWSVFQNKAWGCSVSKCNGESTDMTDRASYIFLQALVSSTKATERSMTVMLCSRYWRFLFRNLKQLRWQHCSSKLAKRRCGFGRSIRPSI